MAPSPYIFNISIGPVDMNQYARFEEIPSMPLKDIKETKRYGRTDGRTDNVKTVYPPTNTVCGGGGGGININEPLLLCNIRDSPPYCQFWRNGNGHLKHRRPQLR